MEYIDFPKEEYKKYLDRINENKIIYTTRVSSEVGKYKLNNIYNSPFGKLRVIEVKHFNLIEEHPFFEELNNNQKEEIRKYEEEFGIDLIGLIYIK